MSKDWLVGVGLAQFGQFGLVLARIGEQMGVVDAEALQPLSAAGIASMFSRRCWCAWLRTSPRESAGAPRI